MPLHLPDHLVKKAVDTSSGDPVAAAQGGAEIALSLVAKWLAAQFPAVHKEFLREFND